MIGILSIISVATQSCAKNNSDYSTKGEMHKIAVLALVTLISNIEIQTDRSRVSGVSNTVNGTNSKQDENQESGKVS